MAAVLQQNSCLLPVPVPTQLRASPDGSVVTRRGVVRQAHMVLAERRERREGGMQRPQWSQVPMLSWCLTSPSETSDWESRLLGPISDLIHDPGPGPSSAIKLIPLILALGTPHPRILERDDRNWALWPHHGPGRCLSPQAASKSFWRFVTLSEHGPLLK